MVTIVTTHLVPATSRTQHCGHGHISDSSSPPAEVHTTGVPLLLHTKIYLAPPHPLYCEVDILLECPRGL